MHFEKCWDSGHWPDIVSSSRCKEESGQKVASGSEHKKGSKIQSIRDKNDKISRKGFAERICSEKEKHGSFGNPAEFHSAAVDKCIESLANGDRNRPSLPSTIQVQSFPRERKADEQVEIPNEAARFQFKLLPFSLKLQALFTRVQLNAVTWPEKKPDAISV